MFLSILYNNYSNHVLISAKNITDIYKKIKNKYNLHMYSDGEKIFIEDDDICLTCENYVKEFDCPLLNALVQGDVYLENSLVVTRCGFYKEFKRVLHIVKDNKNANNNND